MKLVQACLLALLFLAALGMNPVHAEKPIQSYYYFEKDYPQKSKEWAQALYLMRDAKHEEAAVIFETILNRSEDLHEKALAYNNWVVAKFINSRQYVQAFVYLNTGLITYTEEPVIYRTLNSLFVNFGYSRSSEYELFLRKAVNNLEGQDHFEFMLKLAHYFWRSNKPDQIQSLVGTEELRRKNPEFYYYYQATQFILKNELAQAIKNCNLALKANPKFAAAHKLLSHIYDKQSKPEENLKHLLLALQLQPQDSETMEAIAFYYYTKNDFERSNLYYGRCIAENPFYILCYQGVYATYVKLGKTEEARHIQEYYDQNLK